MSHNDYIVNPLDIANVILDKFEETPDALIYHISTQRSQQTCPCCGSSRSTIHDYRKQKIKDVSIHRKNVSIILNKRRYACKDCGKKYYEHFDFICRYKRYTKRLNNNDYPDKSH